MPSFTRRFHLERQEWIVLFLYVSCTLIWGCSFILMKTGLKTFAPDEVAAMRLAFSGFCLLPVSIPLLLKNGFAIYPWKKLGISSLIGNFIPAFLFATAQNHLKSATGGVLNSLTPIFTLVVGGLFFRVPFTTNKIVGVVLGLVGASVILLLKAGGQVTETEPEYAILMVIATVMYGFNGNYVRHQLFNLKTIELVSLVFLVGSIPASMYLFTTPFIDKILTHPEGRTSFLAVGALGCLGTALATFLFWKMVEYSSVLFAASVTYCIPIVAVGIGYFVRDETITLGHILGMAGILLGVWLINKKKREENS